MQPTSRLERYLVLPADDPRMQYGDFLSQNEDLRYEEPQVLEKVEDVKIIPNNSVASLEHVHQERIGHGELSYYAVTMQNKAKYDLVTARPRDPKTNVSSTATTAWLTGIHGLNKRILLARMDAGMPASLLSTARHAGYKPSLEQAAHNQLSIERCLAENDPERDPHNLTISGISRAAMIGIGMNALAERHDWNVMYSDLTAPCFPERLDLRKAQKYSSLLGRETLALMNLFSIPPRTLRHYTGTVDLSPAGLRYAISTIGELTSGNAGRLAASMPEDTSAYILGFEGDVMSDIHEYERRLENHPNVVFDTRKKGAHAAFLHEDVYQQARRRMLHLPEELETAKVNGERKLARASIERLATTP